MRIGQIEKNMLTKWDVVRIILEISAFVLGLIVVVLTIVAFFLG